MKILQFNKNKNIDIFTGDIHGEFKTFVYIICHNIDFENCNIFVLGDIGVGFNKSEYYKTLFKKINYKLKSKNIYLFFIRGNHDDPSFFNSSDYSLSNLIFVDDYDVVKTYKHNILCVGGAISIDRSDRWKWDKKTQKIIPDGYWKDEYVKNIPDNFEDFINEIDIDIMCSHCAPNFIEYSYSDINEKYINNDKNLLDDIKNNQGILDDLFEKHLKNRIKKWYYGHYHKNRFTVVNDIDFICLDRLRNNKISYKFNYEDTIN